MCYDQNMKEISPKEALNHFFPLCCVFVISADKQGKPSGMIASWVMQTSFEPPLITVSVGKTRFTYGLIKQSREFVVAVPNKKLEEAVRVFGTKSGRDIDKFKATGLKTQKGRLVKLPLIVEATLNYECKLWKEVDSGDHGIFIGEVVASWINEGEKVLMNMGKAEGKRVFEEF
jgi:flavin reductase (DIM6/NTAB) family NADH-FMN oxidoreductase RutF